MAPTLRSSITPGRTGIKTTPTKSPRKVPHCTKCQRPRAGHPREGCPYTQSPHSNVRPNPLDITVSMDSLAISPTKPKRDEHRRGRPSHEMTLASLSTESSNILNRLVQPEDTRDRDAFSFEDGKVSAKCYLRNCARLPTPFQVAFQRRQDHAWHPDHADTELFY
jgi:hypothetical protein